MMRRICLGLLLALGTARAGAALACPEKAWTLPVYWHPAPLAHELALARLRESLFSSYPMDLLTAEPLPLPDASLRQPGPEAVAELISLLNSPDLETSERAARVLLQEGRPQATEALIRYSLRLLLEPSGRLKDRKGPEYYHLITLGEAALPAIFAAYQELAKLPPELEPTLYLQHLVMLAAQPRMNGRGLPLLQEALRSWSSRVVGEGALGLAKVWGPPAYPALVRLLDVEKTRHIRNSIRHDYRADVVEALRSLGNPDAVEMLLVLWERVGPEPHELRFHLRWTVQKALLQAFDSLTWQRMDGDFSRIYEWVLAHKRVCI